MNTYSYEELKELTSLLDNLNIPYKSETIFDEHDYIIGHRIILIPFEIETDEIDKNDEEYNALPVEGEE